MRALVRWPREASIGIAGQIPARWQHLEQAQEDSARAEHDVGGCELVPEDPILAIQRRVPGFDHQIEIAPAATVAIAFDLIEFL